MLEITWVFLYLMEYRMEYKNVKKHVAQRAVLFINLPTFIVQKLFQTLKEWRLAICLKIEIPEVILLGMANFGYLNEVNWCWQQGMSLDVCDDDGNTPLHLASENGHLDIVKLFLKKGANPYLRNKAGETSLAVAKDAIDRYRFPPKKQKEYYKIIKLLSSASSFEPLPSKLWQTICDDIQKSDQQFELNLSGYNLSGLTPQQWDVFIHALKDSKVIRLVVNDTIDPQIKKKLNIQIEQNIHHAQLAADACGLRNKVARLFWQNPDRYGYDKETGTVNGRPLDSPELQEAIHAQERYGLLYH